MPHYPKWWEAEEIYNRIHFPTPHQKKMRDMLERMSEEQRAALHKILTQKRGA
jgi:predicted alpha/beta hydrolase family esterase